jgi:cytochrome c551/c552
MIKVLISATLGTIAGIAVMVIVIVAAGAHTHNTSSIGEGNLTTPTATVPSASTTSTGTTTTTPSTSTGGGKGDPVNGKALFASNGCSGCHTFTAAASTGTIGPNLDSLAADAQKAGEPLDQFIATSITDPGKFIATGFTAPSAMPTTFASLSASDLADLVAFISQNQK